MVRRSASGFSTLELLVALAILSVCFTALFSIVDSAKKVSSFTSDITQADFAARALLEEHYIMTFGQLLELAKTSGKFKLYKPAHSFKPKIDIYWKVDVQSITDSMVKITITTRVPNFDKVIQYSMLRARRTTK